MIACDFMRVTELHIGTTLQDVRLMLTKEEAAQAALGNLPRHEISMVTFLMKGFELEDNQYELIIVYLFIKSNPLSEISSAS